MKKRMLCLLLVCSMIFTLLPSVALAAETTNTYGAFSVTYDGDATAPTYDNNTLTLGSGTYAIAMAEGVTQTTTSKIVVASGATANITLNGVKIDVSGTGACAFWMVGATVNLTLMGSNALTSGGGYAGLQVPQGASLIITKESTGSLVATATGGGYNFVGAGIGGGNGSMSTFANSGIITINGGTITAIGGLSLQNSGYSGAGIGGGSNAGTAGNGGTININGGIITASATNNGAGIGGSGSAGNNGGNGGTIKISGGTVIATGGSWRGAGIGGGGAATNGGSGASVTITGGTVKATGGNKADAIGAGVGGSWISDQHGTLKNGKGTDVTLYTLTLSDVSSVKEVLGLTATAALGYAYGATDMKTDEGGKLFVYLPEGKTQASIITPDGTYQGSITSHTATLTLVPGFAVTGTVNQGDTGVAVSGMKVNLYDATDTTFSTSLGTATTNASGAYTINNVPNGSYVARVAGVSGSYSASSSGTITVNDAASGGNDITLTALTTKSIAVTSTSHKTAYKVNESLDVTNLEITITRSDDSTYKIPVTSDMVSDFSTSAATDSLALTITYAGKTTTYNISVTSKAYGGASAAAPTLNSRTDTKVILNPVTVTGQAVEYARSATTTAPTGESDWQDSTTFDGLTGGTDYYFFARVKKTNDTEAGGVSVAQKITTKTIGGPVQLPTICTGDDKPTVNSITITTKTGQEYYISESGTAPSDWSSAIQGDGNNHKFTTLKEKTRYYIHVRVAETDTAMPSPSDKVEQYTQPPTPDANVVTINYKDETISYDSKYEVFTKNDGTGTKVTGAITPSSEEQTLYVRVKAVDDGAPASEWRAVTIPARPAMGTTLTIDNKTEKVIAPIGYSCQIDSGSVTDVTGSSQGVALEPSKTLSYWKTATDSSFRSEKATITAPSRLSHSTVDINFMDETINTTTTMEYSTDGGVTWTDCTDNMSISNFIKATDHSMKIREKATGSHYASEVQTLAIAARGAAPNASKADETNYGQKDGKLTSVTTAMEYKLATATTWTAITGTEILNLASGTYQIRYKATDTAVYSNFQEITITAGNKITLTFDSKGGSLVNSMKDLEYHQTVTPPVPTRTGYLFGGWWINSDGTGTELTTATQIETSETFYAKWTANSYTVTFKANGGTKPDVVQSFSYDEVAKALENNTFTRTNYTFSGWNTAENGTGTSYINGQSVRNLLTENGTNLVLYAQWAEAKRHNLNGEVKDDNSPAVAVTGATVTLKQGATLIATTQTDGAGKYSFTNLLPGTYNLVVTKADKTTTVISIIAKGDSTQNYTQNVILPTAATKNSALIVEKETGITEEVPKIVVGGLDQVAASENADITMTVTQKKEDKENTTQTAIKEATKGQSIGMYLDVKLKKGTDSLTNSGSVLELIFPYNFTSKTDVKVWREHGGSIDGFEELKTKPASSFVDKTFYSDKENGLIYVYANKFSTYAISYTQVSSNNGGSSHGGGSSNNYCTITATAGSGGTISTGKTVSVRVGDSAGFTITPNKGYEIADVKVDGKRIGAVASYVFTNVRSNHTMEAIFQVSNGYENPQTGVFFEDVKKNDWFYHPVMNAVNKGWFTGTSNATFSPYLQTNRGMIATVIHRMEKEPNATAASSFRDVAKGSWYYNGITWAKENEIVKGYDKEKFGPQDNITREQMAAILYRYASYKGINVTKTTTLDSFTDGSQTSQYAVEAMKWAVANELICGKDNRILDPKAGATRGEVATILTRFDELFTKK